MNFSFFNQNKLMRALRAGKKFILLASRKAKDYRYSYLTPPLGSKTFRLAQEQCLSHAAQSFRVFGHATLRGILTKEEIEKISTGLAEIGAGLNNQDTVITVSPVEKNRKLQDVIFNSELLGVLKSILPSFWYYGSDACVGIPIFSKHRDTFYSPPFLKIFIPLVPCTFAVLPGSHWPGDSYSREVSRYASEWDSGMPTQFPAGEVHFSRSTGKIVVDMTYVDPEDLFLHRQINPGDIFIFNQGAVHGLKADVDKNFFLAVTVVPSPVAASSYGLTRTEHLDRVIANIASSAACEYYLSKLKKLSPEECLFMGYSFSDEDFTRLINEGSWHDCFGLRFIEKDKWLEAFEVGKYEAFQRLQDQL